MSDRYEADHRAFVDLFNALRKSFIDKIEARFREMKTQSAPDPAKVRDLLHRVETAMKSLQTIDREKIGAPVFDGAHNTLFDLRGALEKVHRKVAGPV